MKDKYIIEGEFDCECCNKFCYMDEGESIETKSGIQLVCPSCYKKYLQEKDEEFGEKNNASMGK